MADSLSGEAGVTAPGGAPPPAPPPADTPSQPAPAATPSSPQESGDAPAGGSAPQEGDGEHAEAADELDDETLAALARRYKDKLVTQPEITADYEERVEREVARREASRRTQPQADPEYARLRDVAQRSLTGVAQLFAQAAETGQPPDDMTVRETIGNVVRFTEHTERQGAYSVFTSLIDHLAQQARSKVTDEKALDKIDALYTEGLQAYNRFASGTPENQQRAFGEMVLRVTRAYGDLRAAEGAAAERARVEREKQDAVKLARENERIRLAAQSQANGDTPAEPRPKTAPRGKPHTVGAGDLTGDWKSDREKLRAAGIRI